MVLFINYIGFGPRFVAWLVDVIVLVIVSGVFGALLGLLGDSTRWLANFAGLILSVGYFVFYQEYAGQTLGKKALGIKVVDYSGKKPSYMTFFLREIIGKFISSFVFGLGFLWILWDPKKQGWHDKIASTYVVKA